VRIYSPIKQVKDHDPQGIFIRRYVPELAAVPDEYLAEPHKMPWTAQRKSGCIIGERYPPPIVEHTAAYRKARARMGAIRRKAETKQQAEEVYRKHGSRRRPAASRKQNRNR
jgi:deoxyribodipyrimidine photo-lyase